MLSHLMVSTDIGGSHLISAVINLRSNSILNDTIMNTKYDSFSSASQILEVWNDHFSSFRERGFMKYGMAIPGPFDYSSGLGQYNPQKKLAALSGQNFYNIFKDLLGANVKLRFENDAACFGMGELLSNQELSEKRIIALTIGTGLGSCFIVNGSLVKNHASLPEGGEVYRLPFLEGIADQYFSTKWFVGYCEEKYSKTYLGLSEIIFSLKKIEIEKMFDLFCENFIEFILPVLKEFDADVLIFGGNISKAHGYFLNKIQMNLQKEYAVELKVSNKIDTAALLGASHLFKTD